MIILKCTNVGSLGSGEFNLSPGINAVVGPNGSGKSTLVSALYFALTGEPINGDNLDSLISWGSSSCTVSLRTDKFTVTRTLTTSGTTKLKFERGSSVLTRRAEVDTAICEIFGFVDLSILKLVFFAEQYKAIDFVEATDAVRVQMLSSLFGFSRLEKIRTELQKKASELQIDKVGDDVLSSLKSALESSESRRDELLTQHSAASKQLLSLDEVGTLDDIIASPDVGYYDQLEDTITETQCEVDMAYAERQALPAPVSGEEAVKYSHKLRYDALSATEADLAKRHSDLTASAGLASTAIRDFQTSIRQAMSKCEFEKSELARRAQLLQSGKCPLTGGVPCPDLVALTDQQQIAAELEEKDKAMAQLQADYDELTVELSNSESHERAFQSCAMELSSVRAELATLADAADFDVASYEQRVADTADVAARRDTLQQMIAVGSSKIEQLKSEMSVSKSKHPVEYDAAAKSDAQRKLDEHRSAVESIRLLESFIPGAEKAVADSRSSLDFAVTQNAEADRNIHTRSIMEKVRSAFHRDNLPRLLVEDMLEVLNKTLDAYLSKFSFPYKVVWASAGSMLYADGLGQWHKASQLSGGQKYVLVIALRCALIDLLQSEFPLFVLDEPTTGLDVDNREALSSVLTTVVSSNKDRILVVPTHDELLLPTANIINVGVKNG